MNITLEIKAPDLAAAIENLARALHARGELMPADTKTEAAEPEKPAKPARSAAKAKTTPPTSEPETATGDGEKETPEQEPASDESALDYDADVKPRILKFAAAKGRPALIELFGEFGADSGPNLSADNYADFVAAVDKALADA